MEAYLVGKICHKKPADTVEKQSQILTSIRQKMILLYMPVFEPSGALSTFIGALLFNKSRTSLKSVSSSNTVLQINSFSFSKSSLFLPSVAHRSLLMWHLFSFLYCKIEILIYQYKYINVYQPRAC